MKLRNKFKLSIETPTSSQSDIAFLLIIFFIVTAIFFERTGIIFKLPKKSTKIIQLTPKEFIKIELFNDYVNLNNSKLEYNNFFSTMEKMSQKTKRNIAIVYFSEELKYEKFIKVFQDIKKIGNIKISIKPLKK